MKILFLGDYSKLHANLAEELSRRGHYVTLISDGCTHMGVKCDIKLVRRPGVFGAVRYLADIGRSLPYMMGFDVVQFINPHFLQLRPSRLKSIFQWLRKRNGSMFLSLAGNDSLFVRKCLDGHTFRFSEFRIGERPTPLSLNNPAFEKGYLLPGVADYCDYFYDNINGGMAVLPEYYIAASGSLGERLCHTNLPVDLKELSPIPLPGEEKIKILVGMRSGYQLAKGTDTLLDIARQVESRIPDMVEVVNVADLSWKEYRSILGECHINLDQLYSYSPAMNALSSMALQRVAASGAQPEYYDIIGEKELRPIFRLSPLEDNTADKLIDLVTDRTLLQKMALDGRTLVERHNSVKIVADKYEAHWEKLLRI